MKGHDSAWTHVSGQSEFIDDRLPLADEVQVGVLYAKVAPAKIKSIDIEKARKLPGVVSIYTAVDLAHNRWGTIFQDQPLLASDEVQFAGEAVALIAAESREVLIQALAAVELELEPRPAILTISAARAARSFIGSPRQIERGDIDKAFASAPYQRRGHIVIHGADHFYLESQAALAYPKENSQIEIHSSSQHPTEVQHVVADALGLSSKDVVCVVKRMGGAFGGKESQAAPFAAYAALVAHKLKRSARLILTKDDDMMMTGKRNPFENSYRVGFDREGRILALDIELYSDGGAYADLSTAIMERAMLHCDNAYFIPNVRIRGQVCRTHYHPHTAFRGFGGPKGVATIEKVIEEVAHQLGLDPLEVRKRNCYRENFDTTPYGQKVENNLLPSLFEQLERDSAYTRRRKEIAEQNASGASHLRGLSLTPVKFGISFTTRFLNQGNALINIYRDGSVQISTGATEMGQGVQARIADLVAEELGLNRDDIRIMPTSTEKNANTSPTAASSGTDLNGTAALMAARGIKARMASVAKVMASLPRERWATSSAPFGTEKEIIANSNEMDSRVVFQGGRVRFEELDICFAELANEAYLNRISLSEHAHYRIPDLDFNKVKGEGRAFRYFTQGVAASEVSVNRRTGEVKVQRVDILMDLGRPINEALDLGQVWGAFIQGMGWVTTENLSYNKDGLLLSHSPSTYKIPNVQDIPRIFNAKLMPNEGNIKNVRGTKAVGEPPLLLALSVWMAIADALKALPQYQADYPQLQIPATQEVVLRAICPERFQEFS